MTWLNSSLCQENIPLLLKQKCLLINFEKIKFDAWGHLWTSVFEKKNVYNDISQPIADVQKTNMQRYEHEWTGSKQFFYIL